MNKLLSILAAFVLWLSLAGATQAQWYNTRYGYTYYNTPAYPYVTYQSYYAPPVYSPQPLIYQQPPYYWSGQYYSAPYSAGWYSDRYYPWTNQYYYQYRVYPRY